MFYISVLWQNDRIGANYSAIFYTFESHVKSRINPCTLIQSACEIQNDFPRSVVIDGFRSPMEPGFITSWELNGDFGAPLMRIWHLLFSALSMLSRPPAKDIHVPHGDGKEGWRKDLILSSWAKVSLPSRPLFLSDTWAEWYKNN